ncbi:SLAM family member 5-like isoform X2 [Chelonia mydas]|uniref:SLAM family member 5-like isoform X2 n=1 Tax=Chelonia mydas TaxID=8469 RepID=UPI001CA9B61C|nr:SLAM family member 5-like isoform X2 [Chelonia mydas]
MQPCDSLGMSRRSYQFGVRMVILGLCWLLTCLILTDARTTKSQAIQLTGMVGGSVVFPFKVPPWVPVETIVWNSVTTLATFTPQKGKLAVVKVLDKRYIGRLRVLDHTYSLVISNLSMLDRGVYRAQINTEFTTTVTEYLLHVYKKIPVPDIAVAILNGTCNLLLNCSVAEGAESATFIWMYTRRRISQTKEGPTLHISSRPRAKDMIHTCLARNPISQGSKTISIEDYCESGSPTSIFQALKATCFLMFFGLLFSMTNIVK